MEIFLSKFLPLFVYPVGLCCLLIVAALTTSRKRELAKAYAWLAFLVIFIGGNRWFSMWLVHSLESRYPPVAANTRADVIVLLGGGTESQQFPRQMVEVNGAGDRVLYTTQLYREGVADHIIVTGGTIEWQGQVTKSPAEDMAELLSFNGVPAEAVILQGESANTREDAGFSAGIIEEQGWKRVVLVTSALHMPRAVGLFREQGIQVIPAPADYIVTDQAWQDAFAPEWENVLVNLVPSAANLKSTTSAEKEYIGMAVNTLKDAVAALPLLWGNIIR